jgi:2-methylisocitrate lyase-like PEP mutase family enzyme
MTNFNRFKLLHNTKQPLLLNNIWDAASAALVQASGAKAMATSSASLAWAIGYADGSYLPIDELLNAIERIQTIATVPLSVDIEDGYSNDPIEVANLVKSISSLSVVGINIEDGMGSAELLTEKIKTIRESVGNELFINARTDVYLRGLEEGEAAFYMVIERLNTYQKAGANGGFIPGISDTAIVKRLSDPLSLPINIMVSNLESDVSKFEHSKIARFSVGPNSFVNAYKHLVKANTELDYNRINSLFS